MKLYIKKKIGLYLACLFVLLNIFYSGCLYYSKLEYFFSNPTADRYDKLRIAWCEYYSLFEKIDKTAYKNDINKIFFFKDIRPYIRSRSLTSGFLYPKQVYWDLTAGECADKIEEKGFIICKTNDQINIINKIGSFFKIESIDKIKWTNINVNIITVKKCH